MVEYHPFKMGVLGSNPSRHTNIIFMFKIKSITDVKLEEGKTLIGVKFTDRRDEGSLKGYVYEIVDAYRIGSRVYLREKSGGKWTPEFILKEQENSRNLTFIT